MYRCRRLIAVVLSLALVASFFVFNASASETSSFIQARVAYSNDNGTTWSDNKWVSIDNYSWAAGNDVTAGKLWRIDKFRVIPSYSLNVDYWVSFTVGLIHESTSTQLNGYFRPAANSRHPYTLSNDSIKSVIIWTSVDGQYDIIDIIGDTYTEHTRNCQNVMIKFRGNYTSPGSNQTCEIVLDDPMLFSTDTANNNKCIPFFFNCSVLQSYAYILNSQFGLVDSHIQTISNNLVTANSKFDSMVTKLDLIREDTHSAAIAQEATYGLFSPLFGSDYSWNEISYDPDSEEFSTEEKTGSWWDAVVGLFKSINSDAESQAAMQEKANSAGAGDALDNAYDAAESGSFGSLSDVNGIGNIANWNPSNYSSGITYGFSSWFSQDTKNSIDAVPQTRNNNLNIIDFYSQNLEDILEGIDND